MEHHILRSGPERAPGESCLPRGPLPAGSYGLPTASAPSAAAKPWGPSCRAGRAAPRGATRRRSAAEDRAALHELGHQACLDGVAHLVADAHHQRRVVRGGGTIVLGGERRVKG